MEWIKLIGIVIIVIGFIYKLDTIATVVLASLVTALVSGVSLVEFLEILGKEFSNQRVLTIFIVTLPLVGLSETFGLKQRSIDLIQKIKGLTVGSFYTVYFFFRELDGFFAIRLGGHPQFVRPLVQPMGQAAAESQLGRKLTEQESEALKARAAANDNFANFFAQNTFVGAGGVLLVGGTLDQLGYESNYAGIASASLIIAGVALLVVGIYNYLFDRKLLANKVSKGKEE